MGGPCPHTRIRVPKIRIFGLGITQTHAAITPAPPTRCTASTAHSSSPNAAARSSPAQSESGQTDRYDAAEARHRRLMSGCYRQLVKPGLQNPGFALRCLFVAALRDALSVSAGLHVCQIAVSKDLAEQLSWAGNRGKSNIRVVARRKTGELGVGVRQAINVAPIMRISLQKVARHI